MNYLKTQENIWFGWVPNLSGDLFLSDIKEILSRVGYERRRDFFRRKVVISDIKIEGDKQKGNKGGEEKTDVCLIIPEGFPCKSNIISFVIQEIGYLVECEIEKGGLVCFYLKEKKTEDIEPSEVIQLIYNEIKSIFHEHTHHNEDLDKLLNVVGSVEKKDAIERIILQFKDKILIHHHYLKTYFSQPSLTTYIRTMFRTPSGISDALLAEGEMLYALTFVELYKKILGEEKYNHYRVIFKNSLESFKCISEKIGQILNDYENKLLIALTGILLILTILIIII